MMNLMKIHMELNHWKFDNNRNYLIQYKKLVLIIKQMLLNVIKLMVHNLVISINELYLKITQFLVSFLEEN